MPEPERPDFYDAQKAFIATCPGHEAARVAYAAKVQRLVEANSELRPGIEDDHNRLLDIFGEGLEINGYLGLKGS